MRNKNQLRNAQKRQEKKNAKKNKKKKGWIKKINIFKNNLTPEQKKEVLNGRK